MDLTTIARVKSRLEGITSTDHDTVLGQFISTASEAATTYLNRSMITGTFTEYFDVEPGQVTFFFANPPVTSVTSVFNDTTHEFSSSSLVDSANYTSLGPSGVDDRLHFKFWTPYVGKAVIKTVYVGGMAASTDVFITSFPDISGAMDLQVAYMFQQKDNLGTRSVTSGGGADATQFEPFDWLPFCRQILERHRRFNY